MRCGFWARKIIGCLQLIHTMLAPPRSRRNNILLLPGVLPHEFEELFLFAEVTFDNFYDEIPHQFTDVKSWPVSTNLKCWHCPRGCESYPRFIPTEPKDGTCRPYGNFCTWWCAQGFIEMWFDKKTVAEASALLVEFAKLFPDVDKKIVRFGVAKSRFEMREYCGRRGWSSDDPTQHAPDILGKTL